MIKVDKMIYQENESIIMKKWLSFWDRIGAVGDSAKVYAKLARPYFKPSRTYHNLDHILDCLNEFELIPYLAEHPKEVEMAIWYHDVVYDPNAEDNEEKSAEFAEKVAKKIGLHIPFGSTVSRLILATKHMTYPEDMDEKMLLDVDLSILGKSPEKFKEYEEKIRKESSSKEDEYKTRRVEILRRFVERPTIYFTDFFKRKYEDQAQKNLRDSIKRLRQ